jgi:hypothetical protein
MVGWEEGYGPPHLFRSSISILRLSGWGLSLIPPRWELNTCFQRTATLRRWIQLQGLSRVGDPLTLVFKAGKSESGYCSTWIPLQKVPDSSPGTIANISSSPSRTSKLENRVANPRAQKDSVQRVPYHSWTVDYRDLYDYTVAPDTF